MSDAVVYETRGAIAIVTINRPDQRNAINQAVRDGLFEALRRFEESDEKVAILTGAGDRAFCAGMDLKEAAAGQMRVPPPNFLPIVGDNVAVTKPTIAAVNGVAIAGGWLFAQMCDLCVASENATFGISEAKVGRGMPWAVPLINMIPQRIMLELLLTGHPIDARRAYEIGFVNHVVPQEDVLPKAIELAEAIAENAPLTVRAARAAVFLSTEMGRTAAMRSADHLFRPVYLSDDALEGPRAYREKRPPEWKGR